MFSEALRNEKRETYLYQLNSNNDEMQNAVN